MYVGEAVVEAAGTCLEWCLRGGGWSANLRETYVWAELCWRSRGGVTSGGKDEIFVEQGETAGTVLESGLARWLAVG